jgi:PHD/YefM family antitoxin component YafN of YafNO toxin-antitoxin module
MEDYEIERDDGPALTMAIESVIKGDDMLVVTKNDKAAAVVLSIEAYEELRDAYVEQAALWAEETA